jgi:hypothetical protein
MRGVLGCGYAGVRELLDQAVQGYRCLMLAYGQTGAGKTHTMIGGFEESRTHSFKVGSCRRCALITHVMRWLTGP